MATKKDQHKAGIPEKPRGQQTGFAGNPDQNREEINKTPALRGRRKKDNKMFGDASEQHVAANPANPSTNSPSTVANLGSKKSPQGGERAFKRRMARK
ncbi:MAG TPA: hypothetical protein VFR78_03235 [Pyrinomonadaceae bacterium]|nr:hypothetical protein [Pyrinomonadaceae bacterium]